MMRIKLGGSRWQKMVEKWKGMWSWAWTRGCAAARCCPCARSWHLCHSQKEILKARPAGLPLTWCSTVPQDRKFQSQGILIVIIAGASVPCLICPEDDWNSTVVRSRLSQFLKGTPTALCLICTLKNIILRCHVTSKSNSVKRWHPKKNACWIVRGG